MWSSQPRGARFAPPTEKPERQTEDDGLVRTFAKYCDVGCHLIRVGEQLIRTAWGMACPECLQELLERGGQAASEDELEYTIRLRGGVTRPGT
jgi:hypothetical protein